MFARRKARFRDDEAGTATVEFVLWIPVFMLIAGLIVDVTMVMTHQARFYDVARDASRLVALGILTTEQAETQAETLLGDGFRVSVNEDATYATATVSVPMSNVLIFASAFPNTGTLTASVSMFREAAVSGGAASGGGEEVASGTGGDTRDSGGGGGRPSGREG